MAANFSFEEVGQSAKKMFTGKRKWIWIGGLGLVLLLVFMSRRNNSTGAVTIDSYPVVPEDQSGIGNGSAGGVTADDLGLIRDNFTQQLTDMNETWKNQMDAQNQATKNMFDGLTGVISEQQTSFNQQQAATKTYYDQLISGMNADFSSQIDHLNSNLAAAQAAAQAQLASGYNRGTTGSTSSSSSSSSSYTPPRTATASDLQSSYNQTVRPTLNQSQQSAVDYNQNRVKEVAQTVNVSKLKGILNTK